MQGTITPWSYESVAPLFALIGGGLNQLSNSTAWTANRVLYVPFWLDNRLTVVQGFAYVGGTGSSGNMDIGVYDAAGNLVVSKGSTGVGTASTLQALDFTDTVIGPGLFYMAFWVDSVTPTFRQVNSTARFWAALGVWEQLSQSGGLPATATFADTTDGHIPLIGLSLQSVL